MSPSRTRSWSCRSGWQLLDGEEGMLVGATGEGWTVWSGCAAWSWGAAGHWGRWPCSSSGTWYTFTWGRGSERCPSCAADSYEDQESQDSWPLLTCAPWDHRPIGKHVALFQKGQVAEHHTAELMEDSCCYCHLCHAGHQLYDWAQVRR